MEELMLDLQFTLPDGTTDGEYVVTPDLLRAADLDEMPCAG